MATPSKAKLFKHQKPAAESQMDRISRAAREIVADDVEQRETKTARLRKARLEREAFTANDASGVAKKKR
ncbi:hypothetical protein [Thalassovita sp.]|uniref:hypothetical protein n=1 Tax=Thalassovita sp. TaxID=1979401 RepID=UPI0029DE55BF|nr:hypothetical protein [Thalassovita sp.]